MLSYVEACWIRQLWSHDIVIVIIRFMSVWKAVIQYCNVFMSITKGLQSNSQHVAQAGPWLSSDTTWNIASFIKSLALLFIYVVHVIWIMFSLNLCAIMKTIVLQTLLAATHILCFLRSASESALSLSPWPFQFYFIFLCWDI